MTEKPPLPSHRDSQVHTTLSSFIADEIARSSGTINFFDREAKSFNSELKTNFFTDAIQLGRHFSECGIRKKDIVAIATSQPKLTLSAFLAAVSIGAYPVVVAGRAAFESVKISDARLRDVADAFGTGNEIWLVVDPTKINTYINTDDRLSVLEHPGFNLSFKPLPSVVESKPSDPCFFQLTSGSTGTPKPVLVTHKNLLGNAYAGAIEANAKPQDKFMSWLPLHHDMGLVGMTLHPLINGGTVHLMTPFDFIGDPLQWLTLIGQLGVKFTASPSFCFDLILDRIEKGGSTSFDLSSWETHYWGAEPVDFSLVSRTYKALSTYGLKPGTLRPCYGLAEATLAVSISPRDTPTWGVEIDQKSFAPGEPVRILNSISLDDHLPENPVISTAGIPIPGVHISLWDGSGVEVLEDSICGEVVVTGAGVTDGYLRPDNSIEKWENGELHTGDIGFFYKKNIFIVDRIKNIIIRSGVNYSVTQLEDEVSQQLDLPRRRVALFDSNILPGKGRLTLLVELTKGAAASDVVDKVRKNKDAFEPPIDQLMVVPWGAIPTTTSGKKQHAEARTLLRTEQMKVLQALDLDPVDIDLTGSETTVPAVPSATTGDIVRNLVAEMARARNLNIAITGASSFRYDLDFDSIVMLELAGAVETTTGTTLPEEALLEIETVNDLIDLTESRLEDSDIDAVSITSQMTTELSNIPQTMVDIDAQAGRKLTVESREITDFASLNYLGFDLHPDIISSVQPAIEKWGVHPSWTRAVASPLPYRLLEEGLADLVGAESTMVFPTLTLQHLGILPIIAASGTLIVDNEAHNSVNEAAELCTARGIKVVRVDHRSTKNVEEVLSACGSGPKVIAVNGVYSTSGRFADLPNLVPLAEHYGAQIYVDDAHGFGVIGERPDSTQPWGYRGNGIVNHFGLSLDNIIYAGGLSKAYSTMGAFITVRNESERLRYSFASTSVFSGPTTVSSLATGIAGIEVNETEGDKIRARLLKLTHRLVSGARGQGYVVDNATDFPIVTVILGGLALVRSACDIMWEHGILLTPSAFPAAPLHRGGLRFTITANNTEQEVDMVLQALEEINARLDRKEVPSETDASALFSP